MIQDITYSGVSTIPSDYRSPDGALATSVNLIHEDGQLNPIMQPKQIAQFPTACNIVGIHKTASYTNYIITTGSTSEYTYFFYLPQEELKPKIAVSDLHSVNGRILAVKDIKSIGNTLIITSTDGLHYYLWKDNTYHYLGQHLPELPLSFSLAGEHVRSQTYSCDIEYQYNLRPNIGETKTFSDESSQERFSEQILSKVNKFIREESIRKGKFLFPFFVRYAFRLFDGSLTMHSSPVLMTTNSRLSPQAIITNYLWRWAEGNPSNITRTDYQINAMVYDLEYKATSNSKTLSSWKDIIKSVEIYISAPIYTYNQAGLVTGISCYESKDRGYSVSRPKKVLVDGELVDNDKQYFRHDVTKDYYPPLEQTHFIGYGSNLPFGTDIGHHPTFGMEEFDLPRFSDEEIAKSINECCNFYLFKSINIKDIPFYDRQTLTLDKDFLASLVARESMSDDYDSHDKIIPQFSHVYNSRLHLANNSKLLGSPVSPDAYIAFTNHAGEYSPDDAFSTSDYKMYVFINQGDKEIVVTHNIDHSVLGNRNAFPFVYLYYPNPNAYRVVINATNTFAIEGDNVHSYDIPLSRHDFLNGAYYFAGFNNGITPLTEVINPTPYNEPFPIPNKLYVSEVGNPFFFPVSNINTIGTGTIIGLSSANKALSQGQFGQFPLYAFCSDGVWALSVSETGGYSAIQPITRDVCTNPLSIVSTDREVLFATDRGIMMLSGSDSICITDPIASRHDADIIESLPHINLLYEKLDNPACSCLPMQPFLYYISNCQMIFDYLHQRVILFNSEYSYAYVFSLKSKEWGIMAHNIASTLNSYPEALAMTKDNQLVNYSLDNGKNVQCLLVSRPIKLGAPDILKSIRSVIHRGVFGDKSVSTILWGSRDLCHWYLVGSSKNHRLRQILGTGYKFYCIGSLATLQQKDSIYGASVEFVPKQNTKLI